MAYKIPSINKYVRRTGVGAAHREHVGSVKHGIGKVKARAQQPKEAPVARKKRYEPFQDFHRAVRSSASRALWKEIKGRKDAVVPPDPHDKTIEALTATRGPVSPVEESQPWEMPVPARAAAPPPEPDWTMPAVPTRPRPEPEGPFSLPSVAKTAIPEPLDAWEGVGQALLASRSSEPRSGASESSPFAEAQQAYASLKRPSQPPVEEDHFALVQDRLRAMAAARQPQEPQPVQDDDPFAHFKATYSKKGA